MATFLEVDNQAETDEKGIVIHEDKEAINEKINTWSKIKKGEVWGLPGKGNFIYKYQFLKPTKTTMVFFKMDLIEDLESQIPIKVMSISCVKPTSKDRFTYVDIVYEILSNGRYGRFRGDI